MKTYLRRDSATTILKSVGIKPEAYDNHLTKTATGFAIQNLPADLVAKVEALKTKAPKEKKAAKGKPAKAPKEKKAPKAPVEPIHLKPADVIPAKEGEKSGAFIRRMLTAGKLDERTIVAHVLANFKGLKTTVKDVYWNRSQMKKGVFDK